MRFHPSRPLLTWIHTEAPNRRILPTPHRRLALLIALVRQSCIRIMYMPTTILRACIMRAFIHAQLLPRHRSDLILHTHQQLNAMLLTHLPIHHPFLHLLLHLSLQWLEITTEVLELQACFKQVENQSTTHGAMFKLVSQ